MHVLLILSVCLIVLAQAQFNQDVDSLSAKGLPIPLRSARLQRLPSVRPALPTQTLANQRIRRPITFISRGAEDSIATGQGSFTPIKALRPNIPSLLAPASVQIKPVNEEPDEEIRNRESLRENDNQDDDINPIDKLPESQEDNNENLPRDITNLGPTNSIPSRIPPSTQSLQYRPLSTGGASTGRGNIPATPAPAPIQYRPTPTSKSTSNKPRKLIEEPFKQQVKLSTKPVKSSLSDARGKKPVAQIIRRYRNDNPDGSITWGFENDDGSYKEELIGIDCITRGKYGYIDPEGLRREYSYETGIKCDEEQREENGFVDYQENKLVLPDGKTIDLSNMGKKKVRRPRKF